MLVSYICYPTFATLHLLSSIVCPNIADRSTTTFKTFQLNNYNSMWHPFSLVGMTHDFQLRRTCYQNSWHMSTWYCFSYRLLLNSVEETNIWGTDRHSICQTRDVGIKGNLTEISCPSGSMVRLMFYWKSDWLIHDVVYTLFTQRVSWSWWWWCPIKDREGNVTQQEWLLKTWQVQREETRIDILDSI